MTPRSDAGADPRADEPSCTPTCEHLPPEVAETLLATARGLAAHLPSPRHDPFYGLDRYGGPDLRVLERLTRHGDFRKYVFVLDAGGGLGGPARWLALRFGCRVVMLDVCPAACAIARHLARRSRLAERVVSLGGSFEAVPTRDGVFTQVWSVEALHHARDRRRALAELFRVLRPGSPLALQEIVRRAAPLDHPGVAGHGTEAEYRDALAAAGFVAIECEDVTSERREASSIVLSARTRFEQLLAERQPETTAWRATLAALRGVEERAASADHRTVQFFARRPST